MRIEPIIMFLYMWALLPPMFGLVNDGGNLITLEPKHTFKNAIVKRKGAVWGKLPSGQTVITDDVDTFLEKYIKQEII